jgi:hypothetical protein
MPQSASELDALERELRLDEERLALYLGDGSSELRQESVGNADAASGEPERAAADDAPAARSRAPAKKPKPEAAAKGRGESASAPPPAAAPTTAQERPENACTLACRAFSSMQRSADRICALAGAGEARCMQARTRVEEAAGRLARARCAC